MSVQPAFLLIADISGYTRFMKEHRLSLAHAQEIVARLLESIIDASKDDLALAKLEGDAVFSHSRARSDFGIRDSECRSLESQPVATARFSVPWVCSGTCPRHKRHAVAFTIDQQAKQITMRAGTYILSHPITFGLVFGNRYIWCPIYKPALSQW
ncbi:MAG: DUF2652 domain-containing protein [Acidobacteria bacterium]|nr:DUF2652 domain-containing protein [Acidobacteriota bacterium]